MTIPAHTTARTTGHDEWLRARPVRERTWAAATAARPWLSDLARGLAFFFGLFSLLNLVGEVRNPGFDENIWWLDLRPLPAFATAGLLAVAGLLLVWWGAKPAAGRRRAATSITAGLLCLAALRNGVTFYHVWGAGLIRPWIPLPLSFVFAAGLLCIAWQAALPGAPRGGRWTPLRIAAVVVSCGILFPLAQQVFFGKTDYVQRSQVTVVFGAQVHNNGQPSISLVDRVRTAAELYKAGRTERLLMSGAQGVGEPVNEAVAMRELAIGFGVPATAIKLDPRGFNTDATVSDTVPLLRNAGYRRVAVVSDFFHLPRVKLAYQRSGYDVITVPSRARRIPQTTQLVLREIPAFWVYYLRAVLR